jgi:hypothetical protein
VISVGKEWNPKQALLKKLLGRPEEFEEAKKLCLELHASVHESGAAGSDTPTYEDQLWDGLEEETFRLLPAKKGTNIAWDLWHITRIEDITANILIAGGPQVFDRDWKRKLNVKITDTGNAMTESDVKAFSRTVNMAALRRYRRAVGKRTRRVIGLLRPNDLRRKFLPAQLERIRRERGVLDAPASSWIVDFWGRKTVAGILMMPITRHQIVHLNDALKIKSRYLGKPKAK